MRVSLTVTAGPAKSQAFTFEQPDCFLFGRAADARVSLPDDPYVSRQHFLLEIAPPHCKVTDLDSKNGILVNGTRYGGRKAAPVGVKQAADGAKETLLKDGDEIAVGDTRMKIAIVMDAVCVDCGKAILEDERTALAFVASTFLCRECRAKPAKRAAADPRELIEALLRGALGEKAESAGPQFAGYRLEKELGRGGMGVVYKAVQESTGRSVAIKTMLPQVAASQSAVRTFLREVEVTRQLKHGNIVELIEQGKAGDTFFFVLEFVDGMDLAKLMEERRNHCGTFALREFAPILLATLDGLAAAHDARLEMATAGGRKEQFTGVVHRDLKPQNILLARNGEGFIPKVADFGLSKAFESAGLTDHTKPGQIAGTPIYWPREQITHYKFLHPATDVFSIAAVFYEALTGHLVRDGFDDLFERCQRQGRSPGIADYMRVIAGNPAVPLRRRVPSIPEPVAAVIDRALCEMEVSGDPATMRSQLATLRYEDAGAFRAALAKALKEPQR